MTMHGRIALKFATFRQIQVFERIASTGSFTQAANELFLTQPTVSMQMKKLTDDIGTPLFQYIGKRLLLTPTGQELLVTCRNIIDNVDSFNAKLSDFQSTNSGELSLCGVSTTEYFVPELLCEFRKLHPRIYLKFKTVDYETLIQRIIDGKDDYYITDKLPSGYDFEIDYTILNRIQFVAAANCSLATRRELSLKDIVNEDFILRDEPSGTRAILENYLNKKNFMIKVAMEFGNNEAIKRAVLNNMGISAMSECAISGNYNCNGISVLNVHDFDLEEAWYFVHAKSRYITNNSVIFLNYLNNNNEPIVATK